MRTFTLFLSVAALLFARPAGAQYCMLPGRTSYSTQQPGITNFKLATIDRTSIAVENPLNQPSLVVTTDSTTLMRGQTYTVSIAHSKDPVYFPTARNNIRVWIDYNKDFDFDDAGETVISKDLEACGTTYTTTFTVPMTAPLGYTRLRATAKMSADGGHTLPTSCDVPADPIDYHGEMEDYTVKIADPTSVNETNVATAAILVYPSPTQGSVTVSFSQINKPVSIDIFDIAGKQLATIVDNKILSPSTITFDLNEYRVPQGVYFVRLSTDDFLSYQKVVKVN